MADKFTYEEHEKRMRDKLKPTAPVPQVQQLRQAIKRMRQRRGR